MNSRRQSPFVDTEYFEIKWSNFVYGESEHAGSLPALKTEGFEIVNGYWTAAGALSLDKTFNRSFFERVEKSSKLVHVCLLLRLKAPGILMFIFTFAQKMSKHHASKDVEHLKL